MAIKIDVDRYTLTLALEGMLASLKRAKNTTKNTKFLPIIEQDIATVQTALNTMTEIK